MKKEWIFVYFILIVSPSYLSGQRVKLDVPETKQVRSLWCWAACAQMVDEYFEIDTVTTQCQFAKFYGDYLYNHVDTLKCPCKPGARKEKYSQKSGNVSFSLDADYWGPRFERILSKVGLYSTFEQFPSIQDIKNEIDHNRPIIAFIKQSNDELAAVHMVVIKGYLDTLNSNFLLVNDPWFHDTILTGAEVINFELYMDSNNEKSFLAFQLNIHPKTTLMSFGYHDNYNIFRRTSNFKEKKEELNFEVSSSSKMDTITLTTKILSIDKLKKWWPESYLKKFIDVPTQEVYSISLKKSYVKKKIGESWVLSEIKKADYPTELKLTNNKEVITITDIAKKGVTLWQYPSLPFTSFYEFEHNKKVYVTPLSDFYKTTKFGKEKVLEKGKAYLPNKVIEYLRVSNRFYFGNRVFTNVSNIKQMKILGIKLPFFKQVFSNKKTK